MHPSKARFVTACQQTLALGVVLAVLAPAAGVVSLDVIGQQPGAAQTPPATPNGADQAPTYTEPATSAQDRSVTSPAGDSSDARPGKVAAEPVDAQVREVPLEQVADTSTPDEVASKVQAVDGFGTVGVTWSKDSEVADGDLSIKVRTQKDGRWSAWSDVPYDADHGPDPGSAEADGVRPGTDAVVVGDVDNVQVKAVGRQRFHPCGHEARRHRPRHDAERRRGSGDRHLVDRRAR